MSDELSSDETTAQYFISTLNNYVVCSNEQVYARTGSAIQRFLDNVQKERKSIHPAERKVRISGALLA